MPQIANCPACKEKISVPDTFPENALARCPMCQAEFSLVEVAAAAESLPAAIVVEPVAPAAEAPEEPVAEQDFGLALSDDVRLTVDAPAIRAKAESFEAGAETAIDAPEACQAQAGALEDEAQVLVAQADSLSEEAQDAQSKARSIAAKADQFKQDAGGALLALADALESVAGALDAKCETLAGELAGPSAVAEEPIETAPEKTPAAPAEPADQQDDLFGFLSEAKDEPDTKVEEPADDGLVLEEPEAEAAQAESPVQEADMFRFLSEVDQAAGEKPDAPAEDEPAPASADDSLLEENLFLEADLAGPAAVPGEAEIPDSVAALEPEASAEPAESPVITSEAEAPAVEESVVDRDAIQARIDALRGAASALKDRAARLRSQALALRGVATHAGPAAPSVEEEEAGAGEEYGVQEPAEEVGWAGAWQPVGATPSIDLGETAAVKPGISGTVRPRRKKKEKSVIGEFIGIVLGGVAGLTIAYYGLNLYNARFDFAKVYLPGIKHTVKHRPEWWPTWARFEGEPEKAAAEGEGGEAAPAAAAVVPANAEKPRKTSKRRQAPPDLGPPELGPPELGPPDLGEPGFGPPGLEPPKPDMAMTLTPPESVVELPEAAAAPKAVAFVDLKNRPSYNGGELGNALKAAHAAFGCPKCSSTGKVNQETCPDCQGVPPSAMNPAVYPAFCRLGEVLAFVDPDDATGQVDARRAAAQDLVEKVGSKMENVLEVGRLAKALLDQTDRKAPGVMFAGTVQALESKGQLHATTVKLAGVDQTIKVISKEPLGMQEKDRVLILGCLVKSNGDADPAAPLFVWSGVAVKFSK